jgi:hypothetical protein
VRSNALSQERKQKIAREFGFNNTAFLHDAPSPGKPRQLDFFTPAQELRFSGEAILGAALFICQKLDLEDLALSGSPQSPPPGQRSGPCRCILQTKTGLVHAQFDAGRQVAVIDVPHEIHTHARETPTDEILAVQRKLTTSPDKDKMKASYPIVSLRRGLTFTLVDFTTCPSLMGLLTAGESPDPKQDAGWQAAGGPPAAPGDDSAAATTPITAFCGCVYFIQLQTDFTEEPYITRLQVRMIANGREEAVTPTGCCALAAHLALQKGGQGARHAFAVEQGVEIGRRSQLCVEVRLNDQGTQVSRVILSGRGVFITEGKLL